MLFAPIFNQETLNLFMGTSILAVSLLSILMYRNFRQIKKKNKQLENALDQLNDRNANIRSSITYAKRIQRAMLSNEETLKNYLPESFIFFKPKDEVSGDFYWFRRVKDPQTGGDKMIVVAVDCTGHGVPGALMAMIGYNFLNEIIGSGITEADSILNGLHKRVRQTLKQGATYLHDGMEAALCIINYETGLVEFAGAKNPLVYFKHNELKKLKGDNMPIGGIQKEETRQFQKQTFKFSGDESIYLFSDGFRVQFGGKNGEKFMDANFLNLLQEIHSESFDVQKAILEDRFDNWMGNHYFQIDDILVMGFKVNKE